MWKVFGNNNNNNQDQDSGLTDLEKERRRQEQLLQEQLLKIDNNGEEDEEEGTSIENDLFRQWKKDQETQEGLINAAKLKKEAAEVAAAASSNGEPLSADQQPPKSKEELSYMEMAKLGYQELVNAIIRPPRAKYEMKVLGPLEFNFCGTSIIRIDNTLMTRRGYKLECSHWIPIVQQQQDDDDDNDDNDQQKTTSQSNSKKRRKLPVVIYMHGNASCRAEVLPQLSQLLSLGISVVAFDFVGSGKSEGDYVSLGYFEREDLSCVMKHLRSMNDPIVISKIAVWGRSMGAATAIMYGGSKMDPGLACMILDSSFCDLVQVAEELVDKVRVEQKLNIPNFVTNIALRTIEGTVQQKANFSIRNVSPIAHVSGCTVPALFVAGIQDDFIPKHHSEKLYELHGGKQHMLLVQGGHNDPRPQIMVDTATEFLKKYLEISNDWAIPVPDHVNLAYPPWHPMMQIATSSSSTGSSRRTGSGRRPGTANSSTRRTGRSGDGSSSSRRTARSRRAGPKNDEDISSSSSPQPSSEEGVEMDNNETDDMPSEQEEEDNIEDFDTNELGMTEERQHAIEASLAKVLGQQQGS